MKLITITILTTSILLLSSIAFGVDLTERDKQLHATGCFAISSITSAIIEYRNPDMHPVKISAISAGVALGVGVLKEVLDSTQSQNKFDMEDIEADAVGVSGYVLQFTIQRNFL